MPPTQGLSFISLHHYILLSELKIASLTLCLIRITQPSRTYKGGSYLSLLSTYITWLMYRDNTSVVAVYNTRLFIFMSSIWHETLLLVNHLCACCPPCFVLDMNNTFESKLINFLSSFAVITFIIIPIPQWVSKHQQASKLCAVSSGFFKHCSCLICSISTSGYKCPKLAIYCTLHYTCFCFMRYIWSWKAQVNIPGLLWLFHQIRANDGAWSRTPSQWVRGRWYGSLPRIWQP